MEAKDIVAEEVRRQAEFGYEPSWVDFVIAGQKAGIREVIGWMREHKYHGIGEIIIKRKEYEAKLKEWGIKV